VTQSDSPPASWKQDFSSASGPSIALGFIGNPALATYPTTTVAGNKATKATSDQAPRFQPLIRATKLFRNVHYLEFFKKLTQLQEISS